MPLKQENSEKERERETKRLAFSLSFCADLATKKRKKNRSNVAFHFLFSLFVVGGGKQRRRRLLFFCLLVLHSFLSRTSKLFCFHPILHDVANLTASLRRFLCHCSWRSDLASSPVGNAKGGSVDDGGDFVDDVSLFARSGAAAAACPPASDSASSPAHAAFRRSQGFKRQSRHRESSW